MMISSKEQTGSAQDPISIDDAHAPGSVDSLGDKEEYIQGFRRYFPSFRCIILDTSLIIFVS